MTPQRPPIVTNADREWAMRQMPSWARRGDDQDEEFGEIVDDGGWLDAPRKFERKAPNWSQFVSEQIENFEKFFIDQRRTPAEWSALWRVSWWPKANPNVRFPGMATKEFHPYFRKGSPEFARAISVATEKERAVWQLTKVAQFKPDDPRLKRVQKSALSETSRRMTGEA